MNDKKKVAIVAMVLIIVIVAKSFSYGKTIGTSKSIT